MRFLVVCLKTITILQGMIDLLRSLIWSHVWDLAADRWEYSNPNCFDDRGWSWRCCRNFGWSCLSYKRKRSTLPANVKLKLPAISHFEQPWRALGSGRFWTRLFAGLSLHKPIRYTLSNCASCVEIPYRWGDCNSFKDSTIGFNICCMMDLDGFFLPTLTPNTKSIHETRRIVKFFRNLTHQSYFPCWTVSTFSIHWCRLWKSTSFVRCWYIRQHRRCCMSRWWKIYDLDSAVNRWCYDNGIHLEYPRLPKFGPNRLLISNSNRLG